MGGYANQIEASQLFARAFPGIALTGMIDHELHITIGLPIILLTLCSTALAAKEQELSDERGLQGVQL